MGTKVNLITPEENRLLTRLIKGEKIRNEMKENRYTDNKLSIDNYDYLSIQDNCRIIHQLLEKIGLKENIDFVKDDTFQVVSWRDEYIHLTDKGLKYLKDIEESVMASMGVKKIDRLKQPKRWKRYMKNRRTAFNALITLEGNSKPKEEDAWKTIFFGKVKL